MAAHKIDPAVAAHLEWLGFVGPKGLVVSAPALVRAGAVLDRRDTEGQRLLRDCLDDGAADTAGTPRLRDFTEFATSVLNWSFSPKGYAGVADAPVPDELEVVLPDFDETLRPDFAVRELEPLDDASGWQLLVQVLSPGQELDAAVKDGGQLDASAHSRLERLLRQTGVTAGLLFNGSSLRLLSAPRGETSGWLDFHVADMIQPAGRPISTALRLLLSEQRLLSLPRHQRLSALLEDSRKYQNEVSERLAEQVLHALYELLRGLQAAHDASGGELLHEPLTDDPDEVYRALLTVILRLVFLLYAEERDMLPEGEIFEQNYSLSGLYDRLREDAALYPDTMDQRYGAWAQLLVLFRLIHDGAGFEPIRLPARRGTLFDPDRYPFLEGRSGTPTRKAGAPMTAPLVPDGTVYRALEKLLVLEGERISYRALDVEQIGSVYETMMGFRLEMASGPSVAVKPQKKQGAPTAVDLDALVAQPVDKRAKWLQDNTGRKLAPTVTKAVAAAAGVGDLHAALMPVVDIAATPDLVRQDAMVLQPSPERRRSGSHYTPRALTEPIVRTTLEPILARLRGPGGASPTPAQILDLSVCDPAMGSGAFLVETCRQLAEVLIQGWQAHGGRPEIPPDEDEIVFASRLVAQRCLYGVDRNPVAVDLAKMSLWLLTLARDHPLTFLDHALRHGDSLVGLSRQQIEAFNWKADTPAFEAVRITEHTGNFAKLRTRIREAVDVSDQDLRSLWNQADAELANVRLFGDLVLDAFFGAETPKERETARSGFAQAVVAGEAAQYRGRLEELRETTLPLAPFHWEIEFPEVFDRLNPGFDAIVGNPPFGGKNTIVVANIACFLDWLKVLNEQSHGNADLVAHFFRRAFNLLRNDGTFGLLATNTVAQGDTRGSGLRWICTHGGEIYSATRRYRWPRKAVAVVVSIVHVIKGRYETTKCLDRSEVQTITAFLFPKGGHDDPARLAANAGKSFVGCSLQGMGFTFDDADTKGVASSTAKMAELIKKDPRNREAIFPYIGGDEVNNRPTHAHQAYIIYFGQLPEAECRSRWPDLMAIVEEKVKPERLTQGDRGLKERWWQFKRPAPELRSTIAGLDRVLVCAGGASATKYLSFVFLPPDMIFSQTLCVFAVSSYAAFSALQARAHDEWARTAFGASFKDDPRYNSSDVFETFPFPENWENAATLEIAGHQYYEFREALMVRTDEGLTDTYNRYHDPNERHPDIDTLRELHARMDRAVLDAYGWNDVPTGCDFILNYEDDEDDDGRRKKPWRYRWPDDVRDEVLARLLKLNAERAEEESRSGAAAGKKRGAKTAAKSPQSEDLFS